MAQDLNNMSRKELEQLRRNIDDALSTLADRERKSALEAAERAAAEHGYSLADLTGAAGAKSKKGKPKTPAKYRNPEDPTQTWSGRGRKPRWINEAEAAGRPIADFEI